MIKLHRGTSEAVINSLIEIFENNRYADKVIERTLKQNPKWGSRDRRFIAETIYDLVRWWRYVMYLANIEKINSHADYWTLLGTWLVTKEAELPQWDEFKGIKKKEIFNRIQSEPDLKIKESIPDWLEELGEKELGTKWHNELHHLNEEANVILRVNTLKTDKKTLVDSFKKEGIEVIDLEGYDDALILKQRQNVFRTKAFQSGWFEVQDASSQLIAPFLDVKPGMRVIDACAGGGGKSLHIAAKMENKGRIISMDIEEWKLNELKKRAKRAGVGNIETRVIESSKTIKRLANTADRLLLDVPCSGLGVIRRNPDAKWKLDIDFIERVQKMQAEIINSYSKMLKEDGIMVYATCSILPSENRKQVDKFLESHSDFELIKDRAVMPSEGFDGFYMAAIKRKSP